VHCSDAHPEPVSVKLGADLHRVLERALEILERAQRRCYGLVLLQLEASIV
jgi:hypothetical protein